MEKEIKNVEIKNEETKNEYKSNYELTKADIEKLPKIECKMLKTTSKRTGISNYMFIAFFKGLELRDKKFNADKFVLSLLEKKMTMDDINNIQSAVSLRGFYRPIKGLRKDNGEWFYGLDIFVSGSYRPRIFFNELQLKTLRLQNVALEYVEVEIEEELDSFEEVE